MEGHILGSAEAKPSRLGELKRMEADGVLSAEGYKELWDLVRAEDWEAHKASVAADKAAKNA